jgi:putative nucleotidyltransferase with HDIG domain
MHQQDDGELGRWRRRAHQAAALRLGVLCGPVVTSFAAAYGVHRVLPPVAGNLDRVWHLAVLVAVSTLALLVVDRLGRRLLPLVTLLDLSMLFPDRAPSRVKVAREAIRRRPIEEQLARVRDAGADPGAVAREILTLVAALSAHDKPTRGHAERVRMFTDLLAEQLGLPRRDRDLLRWAAILHDVGKLRVPAALLNKPGKPTEEEWVVLKAHPANGAETAAGLLPWLGEWADVIIQHHERYDGTGYPTGLAGARISLGARIVSVADAYDVMTAARAYKRPVSRAAALQELIRFSGTQFDPQVVRAMVTVGAPRLRRAQGAVAWLADIPLVAGAVPASTLARVVGASALATSAVTTGATAMALPTATPAAAAATSISSAAPARPTSGESGPSAPSPGSTGRHGATDLPATGDPAADATGPAPARGPGTTRDAAAAPAVPADQPVVGSTGAAAAHVDAPAAQGATGASPTAAPTKAAPTTVPTPKTPSAKDPVATVVDDTTRAVGTVTGTVTGTVGNVVADPVGTVTGAVSDPVGTVTGTVGTVTGTVGTVTGTVTGAVGTLLGSGSSGSGSSGSGSTSPNSGPGSTSSGSGSGSGSGKSGSGGLLGGLLGH